MTTKRDILAAAARGDLSRDEARVRLRGRSFWAEQSDDDDDLFDVEIRVHALLIDRRPMTRAELEELKPTCVSWIVSAPDCEFVHDDNRDEYPYQ